jgi:hypothetical protein
MIVVAVVAAAAPACSSQSAARPTTGHTVPIFRAAVEHIVASAGWAVRIDDRIMDSISTSFDHERDVLTAPTPTLLALRDEERQRRAMLARLRVPQERIEDYTACTPYIGGVPVNRPEATADMRAATDSARSACAERARYGVGILGLPRRAADGASWKIRVYFVTAVSRQVYDLILAPAGETWTVLGRDELLSASS